MARYVDYLNYFRTSSITHGIGTGTWSFSGWFNPGSNSADSSFFASGSYAPLLYNDASGEMKFYDGTSNAGFGTPFISATVWSHVGLIKNSSNVLTCYVNGSATASTISSATGNFPNGQCTFGVSTIAPSEGYDGYIAEFGFWKGDIGAAAMVSLAKGYSPQLIPLPSGVTRIAYWQFFGGSSAAVPDIWNKNDAAIYTGTPAEFAHPRVFYPSRSQVRRFGTAAAGGGVFPLQHVYRHVAGIGA